MPLAVLENQQGPALNAVPLNAGAAIRVSGHAKSPRTGIDRARKAVASGKARAKLGEFVAAAQKFKAKE